MYVYVCVCVSLCVSVCFRKGISVIKTTIARKGEIAQKQGNCLLAVHGNMQSELNTLQTVAKMSQVRPIILQSV